MGERLEQSLGQQAMLTYMALSATPNMGVKQAATKELHKGFVETIKRLMGAK